MNTPKTPHINTGAGGIGGESAAEPAQPETQDATDLAELEAMEAELREEHGLPPAEPILATAPSEGWLP